MQLRADLASSRESAEALRRDLRAAQADGEGRARERDESTRNLRNELRDADETIGCVTQRSICTGASQSLNRITHAGLCGSSCAHWDRLLLCSLAPCPTLRRS